MKHKYIQSGFSLIELLVVITIVSILAVTAVPMYVRSNQTSELGASAQELRGMILEARNFALTGQGTSSDTLPTGGYGVFVSAIDETADFNTTQAISFIDDSPTQDDFIDAGAEYSATDIIEFADGVYVSAIEYWDGTECVADGLDNASIIFEPPTAGGVFKGEDDADVMHDANIIVIYLSMRGLSGVTEIIEVIETTGRVEYNPATPTC